MKKRILTLLMAGIIGVLKAGEDTVKIRLTKADRIRLAAYDDTTRALAALFTAKRKVFGRQMRGCAVAGGVSVLMFVAGGLMLQDDMNNGPGGGMNPANYIGMSMAALGFAGAAAAAVMTGVTALQKNPYTVRKYEKLIALHKAGKPLPEYYAMRIRAYLLKGPE